MPFARPKPASITALTRTRTAELEAQVAQAELTHDQVDALIQLALWLADAQRSRVRQAALQAVNAAKALDDPLLKARADIAVAVADIATHNYNQACTRLEAIRERFEVLQQPEEVAWSDLYLAIALESSGDAAGAVPLVNQALSVFRAYKNLAGQARCLNTMGVAQSWGGRCFEALSLFRSAMDLARDAKHEAIYCIASLNVVETYTNLGLDARQEGNSGLAQAMFEQADNRYPELEQHIIRIGCLELHPYLAGLQAVTALHLGRPEQAVSSVSQAVQLAYETGCASAVATALGRAGQIHLGLGQWRRARKLLLAAKGAYQRWPHHVASVRVVRDLVKVYEALGDLPSAFTLHKELLEIELTLRETRDRRDRELVRARIELTHTKPMLLQSDQDSSEPDSAQLLRANRELEQERVIFERLAHADAITGLANRRHFDVQLTRALVRAELGQRLLGLIIVDLDHFKQINDRFGHIAGDEVLRRVSTVLSQLCRRQDLVARVGGEELAVLLPNTATSVVLALAERIRIGVAKLAIADICPGRQVTISAGVAVLGGPEVSDIYPAADRALYRAKAEGRNRVCLAGNTAEKFGDHPSYTGDY